MMRMRFFNRHVADFAAKWIGRGVKWAVASSKLGTQMHRSDRLARVFSRNRQPRIRETAHIVRLSYQE
jgi:hypothetical protein